jgi:hypothetical protein
VHNAKRKLPSLENGKVRVHSRPYHWIYWRGGVSTRTFNGAAAFRRGLLTARRRFDAEFKQRGGISTRNLNGAAAFRHGIQTARRHFDAEVYRRGGISTRNLNGDASGVCGAERQV